MGQNDWWDLCIVGCGTVIHCTGWGREGNDGDLLCPGAAWPLSLFVGCALCCPANDMTLAVVLMLYSPVVVEELILES